MCALIRVCAYVYLLCECMPIYLYVCMNLCVYVCIYICVCMCRYMRVCVQCACVYVLCMRVCMCARGVYVCVYICVRIYVCRHLCICVCMYVCVYVYMCEYRYLLIEISSVEFQISFIVAPLCIGTEKPFLKLVHTSA